jgi:hypothetical protein
MKSPYQMTKVNETLLSVDEVVATLRNSSLATLLVEGRSDMDLFCALEEICFENRVDILPVGGRNSLFEIFGRRSEFANTPVVFLADSDMYVFDPPAPEFDDVIFTEGYSIENDILLGGKAFRLLTKRNREKWEDLISALGLWFASVAHRVIAGEVVQYKHHPSQLVCFSTGKLTPLAESLLVDPQLLCEVATRVISNPIKCLRGHTLLDAFGHLTSEVKLKPKCSKDMLLRVDLVSWDSNECLVRIVDRVRNAIPNAASATMVV